MLGCVNTAVGMNSYAMLRGGLPAAGPNSWSTTTMASPSATGVSCTRLVTSPTANTEGTLVR